MKKSILSRLLLAAASLFFAAACAEQKPVLHVFNWDDYISPGLVTRFEEEQGCRIVMDTFDSNESMLAKIKAGATGYDILVPSSYMVKILDREGMLQPIDHARIPNLAHVDDSYLRDNAFDKTMRVSVPYMMAATGVGYLGDKVENVEESWSVFDRTDLKGRVTLLNDVRETIGAALKMLGYGLNTLDDAELAQAKDVVIRWKKQIAKFESDQYDSGLASGEFLLAQGYVGDLLQAAEENENIVTFVPAEGSSIACDDLVIPKDAPNPDLAHAFINFLCDPEVAVENVEYIYYLAPNKTAYPLLSEDIRGEPALFLDPALRAKCEMVDDLGEEGNRKYAKLWDEIKAAPVE